MRIPELSVAALAVAAAAVWVAALVTSLPPPAPVIVVQGEATLPSEDAPWALRFVAVAPGGTAPLHVSGTVQLGSDRVSIAHGTARIERARAGVATFDVVAGGVPAHGSYDLAKGAASALAVDGASLEGVAPGRRAVAPLRWTPWYGEVAMRSAATAPLYPLDGRVSARLPSQVLLLEKDATSTVAAPRLVELRPLASGAALDDGRVLHVDRSGLRIEGALSLDEARLQVHAAEPRRVACDLLVDGAVHDAVNVDVAAGKTDVALRVGATRKDALVVAHCGGVYGGDVGRVVVLRASPDGPLAPWLRELARNAGAPADEPLLALDDATLARPEVARAALARLAPSKVRAPRLDVTWTVDRGPGATLSLVFAALALAVVVAALALGFARMPQRRGTVIFGVAALGAVLGGLYAVLVLLAA